MLRASPLVALTFAALGIVSCRNPEETCPSTPAHWVVAPSPINVAVNSDVVVSVTELTCADRRKTTVYPTMAIADTSVALAFTLYRRVAGLKVGSTTLTLNLDDAHVPPLIVPVAVH